MATPYTVISGSGAQYLVGVPFNNPVFFDGTRYWLFYADGTTLKCKYGTALDSLADTNTDGAGNIGNLESAGRAYSCLFFQIAGAWHAMVSYGLDAAGDSLEYILYPLTASGLGSPAKASSGQSLSTPTTAPGHMLTADPADLSPAYLYAQVRRYNNGTTDAFSPNQRLIPAATPAIANQGMGAVTPDTDAGIGDGGWLFAEAGGTFRLADGYLCLQVNNGDTGDAKSANAGQCAEWVKAAYDGSWGNGALIASVAGASAGDGDFSDQNYADDTSHTGQIDLCQTADGRIWCAYCDNSDTTSGNFGQIKLTVRGAAMADGWSNISTDAIGGGGMAWHLALASDGSDLWLIYCKDAAGSRGDLYFRKYDIAADRWGDETLLAAMQPGHRFERLATQWRFTANRLPVLWTEYDSSGGTYDLRIAELDTAPAPAGSGSGAEGTLFVEFIVDHAEAGSLALALDDGGASNRLAAGLDDQAALGAVLTASGNESALSALADPLPGMHRLAIAFNGQGLRLCADGTLAAAAPDTLLPSLSQLFFGSADGASAWLNGSIRRFSYWPYALSDGSLVDLTA